MDNNTNNSPNENEGVKEISGLENQNNVTNEGPTIHIEANNPIENNTVNVENNSVVSSSNYQLPQLDVNQNNENIQDNTSNVVSTDNTPLPNNEVPTQSVDIEPTTNDNFNINDQIDNLRNMAKPIKENVKNKVISMKTQIIYAGVGVILIVGVAFGVSFIVNNGPKLVCTRSTGSKLVMKFDESGIKSVTINGKEISDSDIATYQTQFSKDFLEAKRSNDDYVEEFKRIVMEYEKSNGSTCE